MRSMIGTTIQGIAMGSALALAAARPTPAAQAQAAAPLRLEVHIFNGLDEVTADAAVKIYPTGTRDNPLGMKRVGRALVAEVAPGGYDVQVLWLPEGKVLATRSAVSLFIERYPGQAGRYIAAVNLKSGHGALELRPKDGAAPIDWQVSAFKAGARQVPIGRALNADGYTIIALPVGRYDVHVQRRGQSAWLENVEVPADHTRLHFVAFDVDGAW